MRPNLDMFDNFNESRLNNHEFITAEDMETIVRSALFANLPDDSREWLLGQASVVTHASKDILFQQGQAAKYFYLLLDGWVKIFRNMPDNTQAILAIRKNGEPIADTTIIIGGNHTTGAEAVSDARLLQIPAKPFLKLLREDSAFSMSILDSVSQRILEMDLRLERLQVHSVPQRFGDFLLSLIGTEKKMAMVELPFDKSLLAASLGMKPETLSRAQSMLKEYGVRADPYSKKVALYDIPKLRRYCRQGARKAQRQDRAATTRKRGSPSSKRLHLVG
ncbi:MAG: Crp/Fnr family transcriptional regulator [Rhodospirillales bacterium]|nr:Crp/Fnr family transcriptional regulator [Rhodospirillales bacterium]